MAESRWWRRVGAVLRGVGALELGRPVPPPEDGTGVGPRPVDPGPTVVQLPPQPDDRHEPPG